MKLLALQLAEFRNFHAALFEPPARFVVLHGENGQGKTNLLEAIYLVGTLRSFRAKRTIEMVAFGAAGARVVARVERARLERRYAVELGDRRKVGEVDGKAVQARDYFGGMNVVLFAADDLGLARHGPAERRRFLDRAVWNGEPQLYDEALRYQRALRERNALLRQSGRRTELDSLLEVYEAQLAAVGASIVRRRRRYLEALAPRVESAFEAITRSGWQAAVGYETKLAGDGEALEEELRDALASARERDLGRGFTSVGPHVDDLALTIAGRPARVHASQGQQRALLLAMKVAEVEHLAALHGEPPILLLDDVSSELDGPRNRYLFEFLDQKTGQVFITTTHPDHVHLAGPRVDFRVGQGTLEAQSKTY